MCIYIYISPSPPHARGMAAVAACGSCRLRHQKKHQVVVIHQSFVYLPFSEFIIVCICSDCYICYLMSTICLMPRGGCRGLLRRAAESLHGWPRHPLRPPPQIKCSRCKRLYIMAYHAVLCHGTVHIVYIR